MMSDNISILLVDDHELIRSGLGAVLDLEPDMDVVGTAGSVAEAITAFDRLQPRVVVADLQLQDGTGLDIVRTVRKKNDATGLIVLTMHSGDDQIFAAMQAGASGFVGKDAPATEVIKAARHAAVSPKAFVCAGLVGAMMRRRSGELTSADRAGARRTPAAGGGTQRGRHRREALPVGVDDQVPHRADLPEARRREPRSGPRHRDANRPAFHRAAVGQIIGRPVVVRSDYGGRDELPIRAGGPDRHS